MSVGPNISRKGHVVYSFDGQSKRHYGGSGTAVTNRRKWKQNQFTSNTTLNNVSIDNSDAGAGHLYLSGNGERDGSPEGDSISLPTTFNTGNYPNGSTIAWWSKISASQPNGQCILFGATTIAHVEFKSEGTSSPYFRTEAAYHNGYSFGTGTIPGGSLVGRWAHFAIVFDFTVSPRQVLWYHDGSLFHTHSNFDNGNSGTGEQFYFNKIGRSTGTSSYLYSQSFKGYISNFLIYDYPLAAGEVRQNYIASKSRR